MRWATSSMEPEAEPIRRSSIPRRVMSPSEKEESSIRWLSFTCQGWMQEASAANRTFSGRGRRWHARTGAHRLPLE
jgi:hypothetical protein